MAAPEKLLHLTLYSVHSQYGGWAMRLDRAGRVRCWKVDRGSKSARRHETTATAEEIARLEGVLAKVGFWDLPPPTLQNPPMPDETWVEIAARSEGGARASVGKFSRSPSPLFDAIQSELAALANRAWVAAGAAAGPFDPRDVVAE